MTSFDRLNFSRALAKAANALSTSVVGTSTGGAPSGGMYGGGGGGGGGMGFRGRSGGLGAVRPARTSMLMSPSPLAKKAVPVTSMPAQGSMAPKMAFAGAVLRNLPKAGLGAGILGGGYMGYRALRPGRKGGAIGKVQQQRGNQASDLDEIYKGFNGSR